MTDTAVLEEGRPTQALVLGRLRKGKPIEEAVTATRERLEAAGWTVEAAIVKRKPALTKRAARAVEAKVDVVVAVGGDGAVLRVVQALVGTPVALGIVPLGTGNLVATNLEIPKDRDDAIGTLVDGRRRTIDVGEVELGDDRWAFVVACGVGVDAEVMAATKRSAKLRWGRLAYLAGLIGATKRAPDARHRIRVDGAQTSLTAIQVLVANLGRSGLGFTPKLPIEPDDGRLDVIVLRGPGKIGGLLGAWEALRQRQAGESHGGRALRARAQAVEIETKPRRRVEVDGTAIGRTPIRIAVRPAALTVLVPPPSGGSST